MDELIHFPISFIREREFFLVIERSQSFFVQRFAPSFLVSSVPHLRRFRVRSHSIFAKAFLFRLEFPICCLNLPPLDHLRKSLIILFSLKKERLLSKELLFRPDFLAGPFIVVAEAFRKALDPC